MKKPEKIFNEKYNQAIITMIRRKFSPLHHGKKHAVLANIKKISNTVHTSHRDSSLPLLPSAQIYNLDSTPERNESSLVDRVKEYLQMKRRENHIPQKKSELEGYISIFEMPTGHFERKKRQSIEFSIFQFEKKENIEDKRMIGFSEEDVDMADDARSMLNAKIRRKLNHKKIIDLVRRN